jgi:hypothetical protein
VDPDGRALQRLDLAADLIKEIYSFDTSGSRMRRWRTATSATSSAR